MEQQAAYYQSLDDNKRESLSQEEERNDNLLKSLIGLQNQFQSFPPAMDLPKDQQKASTDTAKP